jgi:hypothetical protein
LNGFLSRLIAREAGEVTSLSPVPGRRFETLLDFGAPAFAPWTDAESGDDLPSAATTAVSTHGDVVAKGHSAAGARQHAGTGEPGTRAPASAPHDEPASPAAGVRVERPTSSVSGQTERPEERGRWASPNDSPGDTPGARLRIGFDNPVAPPEDTPKPVPAPAIPPTGSEPVDPRREPDGDRGGPSVFQTRAEPLDRPADDRQRIGTPADDREPPATTTRSSKQPHGPTDASGESQPAARQPLAAHPPPLDRTNDADQPAPHLEAHDHEPHDAAADSPRHAGTPTPHREPPKTARPTEQPQRPPATSSEREPAARQSLTTHLPPHDHPDDGAPRTDQPGPMLESPRQEPDDPPADRAARADQPAPNLDALTQGPLDRPGDNRRNTGTPTPHREPPATTTRSSNEPRETAGAPTANEPDAGKIVTGHTPALDRPSDGAPHSDQPPPSIDHEPLDGPANNGQHTGTPTPQRKTLTTTTRPANQPFSAAGSPTQDRPAGNLQRTGTSAPHREARATTARSTNRPNSRTGAAHAQRSAPAAAPTLPHEPLAHQSPAAPTGGDEENSAQPADPLLRRRAAPSPGRAPLPTTVPDRPEPVAPRARFERVRPTARRSSSEGRQDQSPVEEEALWRAQRGGSRDGTARRSSSGGQRGVTASVGKEARWLASAGGSLAGGSRRPAERKAAGSEIPIQIRIGRIDARPPRTVSAKQGRPAEPLKPNMTLQQYLERRRRPSR